MRTLTIQLGFTHSDRASDYIPMMDGYRPGAAQTVIQTGDVQLPGLDPAAPLSADDVTAVAEACFTAMNAPEDLPVSDTVSLVRDAIAARLASGRDTGVHSLSVGDTVTVDGITLACAKKGWSVVG